MLALFLLPLTACFEHLDPDGEDLEESAPWNPTFATREPAIPDLGGMFDARLRDCRAEQIGTDGTTREYHYAFDARARLSRLEYSDEDEGELYASTETLLWNDDNCAEENDFSDSQNGETYEFKRENECDEHGNPRRSVVEEDGEVTSEVAFDATYEDDRLIEYSLEVVDSEDRWIVEATWEVAWEGNYWSRATQRNVDENGDAYSHYEHQIVALTDGRLEEYEEVFCYDFGEEECADTRSQQFDYDSEGVLLAASGTVYEVERSDSTEGTVETKVYYEWRATFASDGQLIPSRSQYEYTFGSGDELVHEYEYELDCE